MVTEVVAKRVLTSLFEIGVNILCYTVYWDQLAVEYRMQVAHY